MMFNLRFPMSDDPRMMYLHEDSGRPEFHFGNIGCRSFVNDITIYMENNNELISLQIGRYCSIAHAVTMNFNFTNDFKAISTCYTLGHRPDFKRKGQILIGNDVWIGSNVVVLPGVRIGNGAVVGAGTAVTQDVPPYAIVVGNRMEIIKYRFTTEQIEKLQAIKYWNWPKPKIHENLDAFSGDIDTFIERFYEEEIEAAALEMQAKSKRILFFPDFDSHYPVWKRVIPEYLENFTSDDNFTLVLRIANDANFKKNIDELMEIMPESGEFADVFVADGPMPDERRIFKSVDYLVTTRSPDTVKHIEMADDFGVELISGLDQPIFDQVTR